MNFVICYQILFLYSFTVYSFPRLSPSTENDLKQNAKLSDEHIEKYKDFLNKMDQTAAKTPYELEKNKENFVELSEISNKLAQKSLKTGEYNELFEGDIILSERQMHKLSKVISGNPVPEIIAKDANNNEKNESIQFAALTADLSVKWESPVRYWFDPSFRGKKPVVLNAINFWARSTCVKFQELTQRPTTDEPYIRIIQAGGCYSYVGSIEAGQPLSLGIGCVYLGIAAHEFGHALGLWHEQSRPDRDSYVKINFPNIPMNVRSNFAKYSTSDIAMTDVIPYDMGSVMHYGSTAFALDENDYTITTIDKLYQNTLGQREGPSFYDVKAINTLYCTCDNTLDCQHDGYADPLDCNKCRCPDGFGGATCEQALSTDPGCGDINLAATSDWQTLEISGVATCNYYITSPEKTNIVFDFTGSSFACATVCSPNPGYGYVELKYQGVLANSGPRLCCEYPESVLSEDNEAMVLYHGQSASTLFVRYKTNSKEDEISDQGGDGIWGKWSDWSNCTASCGSCGVQSKIRKCSKKSGCRGSGKISRLCNKRPCLNTDQPCCKPHVLLPGGEECGRRKGTKSHLAELSQIPREGAAELPKENMKGATMGPPKQNMKSATLVPTKENMKGAASEPPKENIKSATMEPTKENMKGAAVEPAKENIKSATMEPTKENMKFFEPIKYDKEQQILNMKQTGEQKIQKSIIPELKAIGNWSRWSDWSDCPQGPKCGGCTQKTRTRQCTGHCEGIYEEHEPCSLKLCQSCAVNRIFGPCPIDKISMCTMTIALDPNEQSCPCCSPYKAINGVCQLIKETM